MLSPEHEICSDLKFCEVEEFPLFSMKIHSLLYCVAMWQGLLLGNLLPFSDHRSLIEGGKGEARGGRERGIGLLCPKRATS
jgi:hypothetical protein